MIGRRGWLLLLPLVVIHAAQPARASCMATPAKRIALTVATCAVADLRTTHVPPAERPPLAPRYAGLIVTGTTATGGAAQTMWIPASEHLACDAVPAKAVVDGTLSAACCDGDLNPPCLLGTSAILTGIKRRP